MIKTKAPARIFSRSLVGAEARDLASMKRTPVALETLALTCPLRSLHASAYVIRRSELPKVRSSPEGFFTFA